MDKYDAFQSAEHAEDTMFRSLLQVWLVRINHGCQASWRDQLTTAWVARTVHNVLLAVKAVPCSRRAEVFDFTNSRTATQRRMRRANSCPHVNRVITKSCTLPAYAFHGSSCDVER